MKVLLVISIFLYLVSAAYLDLFCLKSPEANVGIVFLTLGCVFAGFSFGVLATRGEKQSTPTTDISEETTGLHPLRKSQRIQIQ